MEYLPGIAVVEEFEDGSAVEYPIINTLINGEVVSFISFLGKTHIPPKPCEIVKR